MGYHILTPHMCEKVAVTSVTNTKLSCVRNFRVPSRALKKTAVHENRQEIKTQLADLMCHRLRHRIKVLQTCSEGEDAATELAASMKETHLHTF